MYNTNTPTLRAEQGCFVYALYYYIQMKDGFSSDPLDIIDHITTIEFV